MGSDLYIAIKTRHDVHPDHGPEDCWGTLFDGASTDLARGIVVDAFGGRDGLDDGTYVTPSDRIKWQMRSDCPWDEEAYWVRRLDGQVFCDIVREKRWQKLQNGDFADKECSPELRAYAAMVESLLKDGCQVRVWCWHSQ